MAARRTRRASRKGAKKTGWFGRCVARVRAAASAYDPDAVCGALLREKRAKGIPEGGSKRRAKRRARRAPSRATRGCSCKH